MFLFVFIQGGKVIGTIVKATDKTLLLDVGDRLFLLTTTRRGDPDLLPRVKAALVLATNCMVCSRFEWKKSAPVISPSFSFAK